MSSFKSNNSSFDPLDYYKKLTLCLANKKNCKINISRVPGGKELMENKRLPNRITEEVLQLKFLAKYNEKKALEVQQKDHQQHDQISVQNNPFKKNPLNFDFKHNALMKDNGKRKKEDETYLNLPPSYFQSTNVPDLAIFKVPEIPAKRPRTELPPDNASNFTLESLFSGNFKPPRTSTPKEQPVATASERPQPIISDPCEILGIMKESKKRNEEAQAKKDDSKMKAFIALIDTTAKKIDSVCFADIEDPTLEILRQLNKTHEVASQSPRPSLLCSGKSSRPMPVFYDDNMEENHKNEPRIDTMQLESIFNKSGFSENPQIDNLHEIFATPSFNFQNDFDMSTANNDYFFDTTPRTSTYKKDLTTINFGNNSILMTSPPREGINDAMDFNWLEDVFTTMDLKWCDENIKNDKMNDAIFRSPPSNRLSLQRKFSEARFKYQTFEDEKVVDDDKNSSLWTNQTMFTVNNNINDSVFDTSFDLF